MNLEMFVKAGIEFDFCRYAVFPQIPYVQDVLYILQLSDEKDAHGNYCPDGARNWSSYIENATLVAAAVATRVLGMERYDESQARKIIAEAIIELCPPEARCLFNKAYYEAEEISGEEVLPPKSASRDELLRACGCMSCREIMRNESRMIREFA
ncbi:hypothetical protein KKD42_01055 [Patescibacteria group bacterium]|nr:hypothetical protein [Patescibacteria group bacterium]